ncbi:MAG: hypothetical protein HY696_00800 [Deltaproteobacteria bacterium]|nr:hypothetical protein [Deltaproteobacteria bacterium]
MSAANVGETPAGVTQPLGEAAPGVGDWKANTAPEGSAKRIRQQGARGREQVQVQRQAIAQGEARQVDRRGEQLRGQELAVAAQPHGAVAKPTTQPTAPDGTPQARPEGEAPGTAAEPHSSNRSGFQVVAAPRADRGLQRLSARQPSTRTPASADRSATTANAPRGNAPVGTASTAATPDAAVRTTRAGVTAALGHRPPTAVPTSRVPTGIPTPRSRADTARAGEAIALHEPVAAGVDTPLADGTAQPETDHDSRTTAEPTVTGAHADAAKAAKRPSPTAAMATLAGAAPEATLRAPGVAPTRSERPARIKEPSAVAGSSAGRAAGTSTEETGAGSGSPIDERDGGVDAALDGAVGSLEQPLPESVDPYPLAAHVYNPGKGATEWRQASSASRELGRITQSLHDLAQRTADYLGEKFRQMPLGERILTTADADGDAMKDQIRRDYLIGRGLYQKGEIRGGS